MKEHIHSTREKILEAGKKEFLEKGFRDASLRTIVKEAGVTTGAFYGYYKSKEDLFDALVSASPGAVLPYGGYLGTVYRVDDGIHV